jgi:hypothetical protein
MATKTEAEKNTTPASEKVAIHLFKDGDKYKGDVFVAVNGKRCLIKRGETVKVDAKFAEVLDHSMDQDSKTADLIAQKSNEYKEAARFMGL